MIFHPSRVRRLSRLVRYAALSGVAAVMASPALRPVAHNPSATLSVDTIEAVVLHPLVRPHFVCLEHPEGQLTALGDALGADCLVPDLAAGPSGRWPAFYRNDGRQNEDWYGWNVTVLAPFNSVVDSIHQNSTTNTPGILGRQRATVIIFRRADGVRVMYAHVQHLRVAVRDTVRAGQPVAAVGNNGPAWFPHTHVGAWKGDRPLQVRFDLRAMGRMRRSD